MKITVAMAVAVGSAVVAQSALADVTINGSINMGTEYLNVGSESDVFANRPAAAGLGTAQDRVRQTLRPSARRAGAAP